MILPIRFRNNLIINGDSNAFGIFKTALVQHLNDVRIISEFFFFFIDKNNHFLIMNDEL